VTRAFPPARSTQPARDAVQPIVGEQLIVEICSEAHVFAGSISVQTPAAAQVIECWIAARRVV
jgi:hypothetical protein